MDPFYDINNGRSTMYEYESSEVQPRSDSAFPPPSLENSFISNSSTLSLSGSRSYTAPGTLDELPPPSFFSFAPSPAKSPTPTPVSGLSEYQLMNLTELVSRSRNLAPFSSYKYPTGVVPGVEITPSLINEYLENRSLHERLLLGRTVVHALAELHTAGFACGSLDLTALSVDTGQPLLARYCVTRSGRQPRDLQTIIQDIVDLGKLFGGLCFKVFDIAEIEKGFSSEKSFLARMEKPVVSALYEPLHRLFTSLFHYTPTKLSPEDFLKEFSQHELDEIIIKTAIVDPLGKTFWMQAFGVTQTSIPWQLFIQQLLEFLDIHFAYLAVMDNKIRRFTTTEVEIRCLKAVLTEDCGTSLSTSHAKVTATSFGRLCDLFGPLQVGPSILINLKALMQEPWFHGQVESLSEAEKRCSQAESFLIRFSFTFRDRFTLTSRQTAASSVKHMRIKRIVSTQGDITFEFADAKPAGIVQTSFKSLVELVEAVKHQLSLVRAAAGSDFYQMFTHRLGYVSNSSYALF